LYDVPLPKNENFFGRDSVLDELHNKLYDPHSGPASAARQWSCLIYGIGGVGKTQLALEYAYRYQDHYDYIFWMRAETDLEMADGMTQISKKINLSLSDDIGGGAITDKVRTWFENTGMSPCSGSASIPEASIPYRYRIELVSIARIDIISIQYRIFPAFSSYSTKIFFNLLVRRFHQNLFLKWFFFLNQSLLLHDLLL
jgi:hypothetical protein